MKTLATILAFTVIVIVYAQLPNKVYNLQSNSRFISNTNEIVTTPTTASIITKVIYNAIPDGYHITYTTSFIGNSIKDVENKMNKKMDSLKKTVNKLNIAGKDIVIDVIGIDPIFDFKHEQIDNSDAIGYKITQNITFNIKSIAVIGELAKTCMDYKIVDLISAQAYINNTKYIEDSLSKKTVEVLAMKKDLCSKVGWQFTNGVSTFKKSKDVFYPTEKYLNALIKNSTLYKHHVSQNSTVNMERDIQVDNYFNLNLKDADYIFNSSSTGPLIQFYYELDYEYTKKDTEAELREKIKKEEEKKPSKIYYIIDEKGELKQLNAGK